MIKKYYDKYCLKTLEDLRENGKDPSKYHLERWTDCREKWLDPEDNDSRVSGAGFGRL